MTYCDASQYTIFTNTQCTVPLSVLYTVPYNLAQGIHVYVKVISYNVYGDSLLESPLGNGAIVVFVPDPPLNLVDVPTVTNAY